MYKVGAKIIKETCFWVGENEVSEWKISKIGRKYITIRNNKGDTEELTIKGLKQKKSSMISFNMYYLEADYKKMLKIKKKLDSLKKKINKIDYSDLQEKNDNIYDKLLKIENDLNNL